MSKWSSFLSILVCSILLSACQKSADKSNITKGGGTDNGPLATPKPVAPEQNPEEDQLRDILGKKCIQVFYDRPDDEDYSAFGKNYAVMTTNLLGHFPEWRRILIPVNKYKPGDISRCKANVYIGSYYDNDLPTAFLDEIKMTKDAFMWMGYNFWQLEEDFNKMTGFNFAYLSELDYSNKTSEGKPSFLSEITYKGEVFKKYGEWSAISSGIFLSAPEQSILELETGTTSNVLAWSSNPVTNQKVPWAVRNANFFYITEIPFSFITESDRYLVFSDLLFDLLNENPQEPIRAAVVRLEDVNSSTSIKSLRMALKIYQEAGAPAHLAVIPEFRDPFGELPNEPASSSILETPQLLSLIQSAPVVIWHGVTHQLENQRNPFSGLSGDDYEFWDEGVAKPIAGESPKYFLDKLLYGFTTLKRSNLKYSIWMTPHYKASALANSVFSKVFNWQIGRNVYFDYSKDESVAPLALDSDFSFEQPASLAAIIDYLDQIKVSQTSYKAEQFFPYPIYGDRYGQNYIPENLGNVQPDLNEQVLAVRSVETILKDAKRNLVLRDVWGSAFFHPFLLEGKTKEQNDLKTLLHGLKELGYQFVNLNDWTAANEKAKLKKRIIDLSIYR